MNETLSSILEWAHKRATSTFLMTYVGFWITLHWQVVYVTLFVNEGRVYDKFHLLKNEYISKYFIEWHGISTIVGYITPLLLTWVFIWILPKYVFMPAFKKERSDKIDRQIVIVQNDIRLEKKKVDLATENAKILGKEREIVEIEKEIEQKKDPERELRNSFKLFASQKNAKAVLDTVQNLVYKHNGYLVTHEKNGNWLTPTYDTDLLAVADYNGLITIGVNNIITLTDKGKYFLRLSHQNS